MTTTKSTDNASAAAAQKHTAGEWLENSDVSNAPRIITVRGSLIATTEGSPLPLSEKKSNARLMPSSNRLFKALQTLVNEGECYCVDEIKGICGHCVGRAAIQKATNG